MGNEIDGATKSLKASVRELTNYMNGEENELLHGENRSKFNEMIAEVSQWWFAEGFSIAHKICVEKISRGEDIQDIEFSEKATWLAPGIERKVKLKAPNPGRPDASWKI
jgi:hypothetical protein